MPNCDFNKVAKGAYRKCIRSNFPIFDQPLSSCLSLFVLHVTSLNVCFRELPPTPSQKKFRDGYGFSNEKLKSKKTGKNFFLLSKHKKSMFLHSCIYNDNKNIYKFIKKR